MSNSTHPERERPTIKGGYIRYIEHMGSDLSIVRNARVSHDAVWRTGQDQHKDARLINFLMEHGHNTPFESCVLTIEVKCPMFIARQWHRHRTQSYNEVSARYTEMPNDYYVPPVAVIGEQSAINHQAREIKETDKAVPAHIKATIDEGCALSFRIYQELLNMDCPRELARSVLPMATFTRFFATANLHNWFRFIKERIDPGAQWEIQQYARELLNLCEELYPYATTSFMANNGLLNTEDA